ncbi:GIN domain-containing protein [Mariniflexile aquimaris]|uniref:GIN domain-containing protein n=1 Tax=Mariniflexile aquimaris TaxID=881009 RepID=A0ABW3BQM3_9FLAO
MNKLVIAIFFTLGLCLTVNAQYAEKVRGDKNVTSRQTEINSFHTIIVDEDFEIDIIYNNMPSVIIETDENLHEFIHFNVIDGVLTFDKTAKITSKKKLNITVNYDDNLANIRAIDKGEITSLSSMNLLNTLVITEGSAKVGLTIKTSDFKLQSNGKSKVRLNLTADNTTLTLSDNSKIDALIYSPATRVDLYLRSSATIEGETNELVLKTDNYSQFNGKNFTSKTCSSVNEISSDAYLEVLDNFTIDASGSSSVYLYGNPKIIVTRLEDTSKLQKKLK